jgi:glycosyltransferase involved in cell wall biosynthesis
MKVETEWSRDCDLFIASVHHTVPFCHARLGVLIVLFPFYDPGELPDTQQPSSVSASLQAKVRKHWYQWKLRQRKQTYQVRSANSEFTRKWTKLRWGVDCELLYPPINLEYEEAIKSDRILSVGRFATGGGHKKNQLEMLDAFADLRQENSSGWSYDCVGACGSSPEEMAFFDQAKRRAYEVEANVIANADRAQLGSLYRAAKIFWHAAGLNTNEESHPELAEHFGMTTVEAMSAGCVPVVINKGGQREIVEHGVSGFLWETLEELGNYTRRLTTDHVLWTKMSNAARLRSQKFGRQAFLETFQQLLNPYMKFSAEFARTSKSLSVVR